MKVDAGLGKTGKSKIFHPQVMLEKEEHVSEKRSYSELGTDLLGEVTLSSN